VNDKNIHSPSLSNLSESRRDGGSQRNSQTLLERIKDGIERSDSTKRNRIEEILRSRINQIHSRSGQDNSEGNSLSKSLRKDLRHLSKSRDGRESYNKDKIVNKAMEKSESAPKISYLT
jgi:hypothetical protein